MILPSNRRDGGPRCPEDVASEAAGVPESGGSVSLKRGLDFVLALLFLAVGAPLMVVSAVLVKLTSRGPVLSSQVRLGLRGRPFVIYKIRTMTHRCEDHSGPRWCVPGDARVTPV